MRWPSLVANRRELMKLLRILYNDIRNNLPGVLAFLWSLALGSINGLLIFKGYGSISLGIFATIVSTPVAFILSLFVLAITGTLVVAMYEVFIEPVISYMKSLHKRLKEND